MQKMTMEQFDHWYKFLQESLSPSGREVSQQDAVEHDYTGTLRWGINRMILVYVDGVHCYTYGVDSQHFNSVQH